jgi:cobalamin biosynthesis protein CobT
MLARILATENLTVRHDPSAQTASMDVVNRVLTLPVWTDMTNEVYDMLIGHEVGHALFTPHSDADKTVAGPWCAAAEEIAGINNETPKCQMLLNIVEDARIERLMKQKFPGMRRDFFKAYEYMKANNFFGINDKSADDLNALRFADRINMHYKLGTIGDTGIHFSDAELAYLKRIDAAKTFDDIKDIVRDLWNTKAYNEPGKREQIGNGDGDGDMGEMSDDGNDSGQQNQSKSNSGQTQSNQSSDGTQSSQSPAQSPGGNNQDSNKQDTKQAGSGINGDAASVAGSTQQSMQDNLSSRTRKNGSYSYKTLPEVDLSKVIMGWRDIANEFAKFDTSVQRVFDMPAVRRIAANMATKFMSDSKPTVSLMVKEFEMRKAADAAARVRVASTGVLDGVRVCNYRITDDIFRRHATVQAGKNHGFVIFIDWSGSMSPVIGPVLDQALQVMMFCRRVGIPFDVYAFSSNICGIGDKRAADIWKSNNPNTDIGFYPFTLLHLFSSSMSASAFNHQVSLLWSVAHSRELAVECNRNGMRIGCSSPTPDFMSMGSTPLDESIACAMKIVPEFRSRNRVQIVNTVFLTDGATTNSWGGGSSHESLYSDRAQSDMDFLTIGHKNYAASPSSTSAMLRALRDQCDTRVIGFYLVECPARVYTDGKFTPPQPNKYSGRIEDSYSFIDNGKSCSAGRIRHWLTQGLIPLDRPHTENQYSPRPIMTAEDCKRANEEVARFAEEDYCIAVPTSYIGAGYDEMYMIRANMNVDNTDHLGALDANTATVAQVKRALLKSARGKLKSRKMFTRFISLISTQV